jgi:hypothetical protein
MDILLQRKLCWLDPVPRQIMKKCSQVNLLSKEGQVTSVPAQLLIASSPYLNSILMMPSFSCSPNSISLPSATSSTLKLLAQILCMGETEESGGLEMTMINMRELQDVFVLLGINIKLCPKLSYAKLAKETGSSGGGVVKEEVLESEDNQLIKKKSNVAKMSSSSGMFRQSRLLKEFKKNIMRNLTDEVDANCSEMTLQKKTDTKAGGKSLDVKFSMQSDSVNLVKCDTDVKKSTFKKSESEEAMCNICSVQFAKYTSLRRHYRENHGIQDKKSGREVTKPSVQKCLHCGLKFRFRGSLLRHIRRVHNSENKQKIHSGKELYYNCGDCDEKYLNIHFLQRHMKDQHSKEIISVSCQDCSLVLTNRKDMNQHCQEVHKRNNESIENVKMEVLHEDNLSKLNKRRNKCNDCGKTFKKRSGGLKKHIERFHEGKTYGCGVCEVICAYKRNVQRHCIDKGHDKNLIYVIVDLPQRYIIFNFINTGGGGVKK